VKIEAIQVRPQNNGVLFPDSFIDYLKKEIGLHGKILNLFCGKSSIGDTCDIIPFKNPKYNLDLTKKFPFKDNTYDYVLADPPYDYSVHKNLADTFKAYSFIDESIRVCKEGGYVVIFHFLNYIQKKGLRKTHLIGVDIGPNFTARWLNIFRKENTLNVCHKE